MDPSNHLAMPLLCQIDETGRLSGDGTRVDVAWWSFTKTVLAAAALRLVEQGKGELDAALPGEAFTLRQLLRHEAGLPDYGGLAAYHQAVARGDAPWPFAELLQRANRAQPPAPPPAPFLYSNLGYRRVFDWIAAASGRPTPQTVRALVLEPAGATGARFALLPEDLAGVEMGAAAGYHPGWVYHGLIVGPLEAAARVLSALLRGDLLGPDLLREMCQARALPHFARPPWAQAAYGLGLMIPSLEDGDRLFGHTGGGPGSGVAIYGRRTAQGWRVAAAWRGDEDAGALEHTVAAALRR